MIFSKPAPPSISTAIGSVLGFIDKDRTPDLAVCYECSPGLEDGMTCANFYSHYRLWALFPAMTGVLPKRVWH